MTEEIGMSSFKELLDGNITDPLKLNLALAKGLATLAAKLDADGTVTDTDYLATLEAITI